MWISCQRILLMLWDILGGCGFYGVCDHGDITVGDMAGDAVGDGVDAGKNCAKNIHVRLRFCFTGLMYEFYSMLCI